MSADEVPIAIWWGGVFGLTLTGYGWVLLAWVASGLLMVWNCVLSEDAVTGSQPERLTATPIDESVSLPSAQTTSDGAE